MSRHSVAKTLRDKLHETFHSVTAPSGSDPGPGVCVRVRFKSKFFSSRRFDLSSPLIGSLAAQEKSRGPGYVISFSVGQDINLLKKAVDIFFVVNTMENIMSHICILYYILTSSGIYIKETRDRALHSSSGASSMVHV